MARHSLRRVQRHATRLRLLWIQAGQAIGASCRCGEIAGRLTRFQMCSQKAWPAGGQAGRPLLRHRPPFHERGCWCRPGRSCQAACLVLGPGPAAAPSPRSGSARRSPRSCAAGRDAAPCGADGRPRSTAPTTPTAYPSAQPVIRLPPLLSTQQGRNNQTLTGHRRIWLSNLAQKTPKDYLLRAKFLHFLMLVNDITVLAQNVTFKTAFFRIQFL